MGKVFKVRRGGIMDNKNISIKSTNYEHMNRALPNWDTKDGKYISSKAHYDKECAKAGLVSESKAENSRHDNHPTPAYSKDSVDFLRGVQNKTDSKGNVRLSDREIDFMVSKGIIKDRDRTPKNLPTDQGGMR